MQKSTRLLVIQLAAVFTGALVLGDVQTGLSTALSADSSADSSAEARSAKAEARRAEAGGWSAAASFIPHGAEREGGSAEAGAIYAITGAKIVSGAGATIDKGTILMRDGIIEAVGASVTLPPDAMTIDGAGLTVYPGLIDMANASAVQPEPAAAPAAAAGGGGGGGGGRGGGAADPSAWEDQQRAKRLQILKPAFLAAENVRIEGTEMQRLAAAGITSVLAVPPGGTLRGQSALVNVLAPADDELISGIADYRTGITVVKSPVALHVGFGAGQGGGRGGGYPGSLLGYIAFVRQAFYDAQWQKDARAYSERHKDQPRPVFEPELDAIAPALERKIPVAFDADQEREIRRALAMAKEFNLNPIIVGGAEAAETVDDLKAAGASVILTLNFPSAGGRGGGGFGGGGGGGGGGRGGGGGEETLSAVRARVNAPRGPAALEKAGVPFAFTTGGMQNLGDFARNAGRAIKEGGLPADVALRAMTSGAARLAGVSDRLGTIEKGKIANLVVTDGDLFDGSRIRHVFVDGRPVDITVPPAAPAAGGRGRGGSRR
jgi:imidazolonepropionase-like amidohydrolase